MASPENDPFLLGQVSNLFNEFVDQLQESAVSALGALHDLIDAASTDAYGVVNDAAIALLSEAQQAGDPVAGLISEVFEAWWAKFGGNIAAVIDLARRLHEQFADLAEFYRQVMEGLLGQVADLAQLFHDLARALLDDLADFQGAVNTVLMPVFAIGAAVFGADVAAEAIWTVLGDTGSILGTRVSALALGVAEDGLAPLSAAALTGASFVLPVGTWLAAALLDALRQAGDFAALMEFAPTGNAFLDIALGPVSNLFAGTVVDYIANVEALAEATVAALLEGAENDAKREWLLLQLARFTPVGVLLLIVGTAVKLVTSPAPWLTLLFNPIEQDPDLSVVRLARPGPGRKYVILSDIHRDERATDLGRYRFGSIDHFRQSRDTYLEILKHHADAGYVIIEAGDCEELWFHRDFSVTIPGKMQQIVDDNSDIYNLLRSLHADGRYFRIFGNHDSYLRREDVFAPLKEMMERDGAPEFRIHDFLVIEGVKDMHDVPFYLGLDSNPNAQRKPMIVTHGHQWDFWNCDANNILGKIIVSAVVTPLDMLDDPFRDIAGISNSGTPLVNFKQILGDLPVFNSWQSYEPAVQRLDRIQHMEDQERFFTDDIQYSETLAAIMGMMIPVAPGAGDTCSLSVPGGCLFNIMAIGHTHNPHNMPYFDLGELPGIKGYIDGIEATIAEATNGLFNPQIGLVRSLYINSGVNGWYENCFWGVDLGDQSNGTGQPKLVTWTWNTRVDRPNHMDWELPHIPRDDGATAGDVLDARLQRLLAAGLDLSRQTAESGADAVRGALGSVPVAEVVRRAAEGWKPVDVRIGGDRSREGMDTLFLQLAVGLMQGTAGQFRVSLDLPKPVAADLARLMRSRLPGLAASDRRRMCAAIATLAVTRGVARMGLRGGQGAATGPGSDEARAIGLLMLFTQFAEAKAEGLAVEMTLSGGQVTAEFRFAQRRTAEAKSLPGTKRAITGAKAPTGRKATGLRVHAFLQGASTPLAGWDVRIESRSGRATETMARAVTGKDGIASLTGMWIDDGHVRLGTRRLDGPELALYPPKAGTTTPAILRQRLEQVPDTDLISLPVTYAGLVAAKFYKGSKLAPKDQRLKSICDHWQRRLADKRDPHARADLCLNDLLFSVVGALDSPKTEFEKQAAKIVETQVKDKDALKKAAAIARDARKQLHECLGDDHVECDGSGKPRDLGERLITGDPRFNGLVKFFGTPTPNPLSIFGELAPKPGLGLPTAPYGLLKDCMGPFLSGELPPEVTAVMQTLLDEGILSKPRVNLIEIWDHRTGRIARRAKVHDKTLTFFLPDVGASSVEQVEQTVDMDVPLDGPSCLVLHADATNRQAMITDVEPGQTLTIFGSGFVSAEAEVTVSRQPWYTGNDAGRLVPQDQDSVLPVPGFAPDPLPVHGQQLPLDEVSTPTGFNGDVITFAWPEAAAQPGLYRLRLSFRNQSQYPSSATQDEDCTITISHDDVSAQDILFAVLPAPSAPGVRMAVDRVTTVNVTDPEAILGVPWPDDLFLFGSMNKLRMVIPDNAGDDPFAEILDTFTDSATWLMFAPGDWPYGEVKLFPSEVPFEQLGIFEVAGVSYILHEVDGIYDKAVGTVLLSAAVIVATLILALLMTALFILCMIAVVLIFEPTPAEWIVGALAVTLAAFITFIFGSAFATLLGGISDLMTTVDGSEPFGQGLVSVTGHGLLYEHADLRFHRIQAPGIDLDDGPPDIGDLGRTFNHAELGGVYNVEVAVEADG